MGFGLFKRVIYFANMPFKLLMPSSFTNITEFAIKTIPSASKIEIKRVMESLYGFEVAEVRTLNMEGKKKKRGGILLAQPAYKKAYIMLKYPLSVSPELFPIPAIQEDKRVLAKQSKSNTRTVENEGSEGLNQSHWLDEKRREAIKVPRRGKGVRGTRGGGFDRLPRKAAETKFPFSFLGDDGRAPGVAERKFPWSSLKTLSPR